MRQTTQPDPETVPSLCDLMGEAFHLSCRLAYGTIAPGGTYFNVREGVDLPDKVWTWVDGLMHKHYEKHATGRCSWAAMAAFSVEDFEAEVCADIAEFRTLLATLGEPKQLTCADMAAMGYRGSGAGYTPEDDRIYYLERAREQLATLEAEGESADYDREWNRLREIRHLRADVERLSVPGAKLFAD